jgi:hypothetical protein
MKKGVDFDDSFSPTPGLAVGRFMLSLAVANDYELHACDIEHALLQVKEYLGCEVIRDRAARTGKLVQTGYAERVLRTFGRWDCNPVLTPLDPNVRLTKRDSPEVVDPRLHRRMRSIVGCLSYLVNMTRPDSAFTYSQLSKFVQSPGPVHLAAAERALAYLRGTYNEGITYCDPGEERLNKPTGWVDSDFAADPDTRKSMTGYLFSLNGGAVSWRSSRQGCHSQQR